MHAQYRITLIVSLVLILILGACGSKSTTPTATPGAGTTAVATPEPTATPTPSPAATPSPAPAPTSTPVALSFIQQPTQILVNGLPQDAVSQAASGYSIYSIDTDGTNLHRIDPEGMHDLYPVWSPDGQQITFTRLLLSSVDSELTGAVIVVTNADGTNERILTDSKLTSVNSIWSPDGTQIAFVQINALNGSETEPDAAVWVMNADGTNLHEVGKAFVIGAPSWSPDGSQLVFAGPPAAEPSANASGQPSIYVARADGTNLHAIANSAFGPLWSPDGSKISFLQLNEAPDQESTPSAVPPSMDSIWVVGPDGSDPRALTGDQFRAVYFTAWSPDGKRIVFKGTRVERSDVSGMPEISAGIYVMNDDGSNQRQISGNQEATPLAPSWSADGSAIAYLAIPMTAATADSDLLAAELRLVVPDGSEQGTILRNFFVIPVADPFDGLGSPTPAWRPTAP